MKLKFIKREPNALYYEPIIGFFERLWLYLKSAAKTFVTFVIKNEITKPEPPNTVVQL